MMTTCEENKCTEITNIQCSVESVNDLKKGGWGLTVMKMCI